MRAKVAGSGRPCAECDLGECLEDLRMLYEGCPNVQANTQCPKSSLLAGEIGSGKRGGASMISLNVDSSIHGFDEPLGLLSDCHRRIEHFLAVLIRVTQEFGNRALTVEAADAVRNCQRYFTVAAPRHTDDEEESLFPRIRAAAAVFGESYETLDRLEADHEEAQDLHAKVNGVLEQWVGEGLLPATQSRELLAMLERLQALYLEHIGIEDREVFPVAADLLTTEQLADVGREMKARRQITNLDV